MHVTSEVQIDILGRSHGSESTASCAPFDAEDRPQGRLAQTKKSLLANLSKAFRQGNGSCCFSFAGFRRRDSSHKNQFAIALINKLFVDFGIYFGFIKAIWFHIVAVDPGSSSDFSNFQKRHKIPPEIKDMNLILIRILRGLFLF